MSEEVLDGSSNAGEGQRPVFLTVVCILSFIGAGLAVLGYIAAFALMGMAESALGGLEDAVVEAGGTSSGPGTGMIWAYIIVGFATVIVSLVGVIKMWKLQKSGFMLYAGASVVSIIMGIMFAGFTVGGVIFPVAFIAMYYVNLKHMK